MSSNKEYSDDDIKKLLTEMVKRSGFSLENAVAKVLKKNYTVQREVPFYDKEFELGRNIDVTAITFIPELSIIPAGERWNIGSLCLVIECKNIPGNVWLFAKDDPPVLVFPSFVSKTASIPVDPANAFMPSWPIEEIPYVSGHSEYVFDKTKSNKPSKKDPDNLYSAIVSVTKATSFKVEEYKKVFDLLRNWTPIVQNYNLHFVFLQPVIVFSGKIFITEINAREDDFESVKYVQIPTAFVTKDYDERRGTIHIVTSQNFEEYLSIVRKHYGMFEQKIEQQQAALETAVSELNLSPKR